MDYITSPIYNAYSYIWSYFYPEKEYDCDATLATNKLKALIFEIFNLIKEKKSRYEIQLNQAKEQFVTLIHDEHYQDEQRVKCCRIITNLQSDIDMLSAIQTQILKIYNKEAQFVSNRKDQDFLQAFLPTIDNLVFAASYDGSIQVKLTKFTDFLQFLWGKEYVLNPDKNFVEADFQRIMTKIPTDEDYEATCLQFSIQSYIQPQYVYRCNEEKSKIYLSTQNNS